MRLRSQLVPLRWSSGWESTHQTPLILLDLHLKSFLIKPLTNPAIGLLPSGGWAISVLSYQHRESIMTQLTYAQNSEISLLGFIRQAGATFPQWSRSGHQEIEALRFLASTSIPETRVSTAESYLLAEAGTWARVSPHEYLDKVFGLDAVFVYKGKRIGIDITTNPHSYQSKLDKQRKLQKAYRALRLHVVTILVVTPDEPVDLLAELDRLVELT
jgi:hypothetical protein